MFGVPPKAPDIMVHVKGVKTEKRKIGDLGESVAETFLIRKGFNIIEKNYWKPWGEIDIVAEKGGCVRFIEVKTVSRESSSWGIDVSREIQNTVPKSRFILRKSGKSPARRSFIWPTNAIIGIFR